MSSGFLTVEQLEAGRLYRTSCPDTTHAFLMTKLDVSNEVTCRFINFRTKSITEHYYGRYEELDHARFVEAEDYPVYYKGHELGLVGSHFISINGVEIDLRKLGACVIDSGYYVTHGIAYSFKHHVSIGLQGQHAGFNVTVDSRAAYDVIEKVSNIVDRKDYMFFPRYFRETLNEVPSISGLDIFCKDEYVANLIKLTFK
jgi:hypothetical protein